MLCSSGSYLRNASFDYGNLGRQKTEEESSSSWEMKTKCFAQTPRRNKYLVLVQISMYLVLRLPTYRKLLQDSSQLGELQESWDSSSYLHTALPRVWKQQKEAMLCWTYERWERATFPKGRGCTSAADWIGVHPSNSSAESLKPQWNIWNHGF